MERLCVMEVIFSMFNIRNYKVMMGLKVFLIKLVLNCWMRKMMMIIFIMIGVMGMDGLIKVSFLIVEEIEIGGVMILFVSKVVLLMIVGIMSYFFLCCISV